MAFFRVQNGVETDPFPYVAVFENSKGWGGHLYSITNVLDITDTIYGNSKASDAPSTITLGDFTIDSTHVYAVTSGTYIRVGTGTGSSSAYTPAQITASAGDTLFTFGDYGSDYGCSVFKKISD